MRKSGKRLSTADYIRRYRERKRSKGLCAWGGCNIPSGSRYLCDKHRKHRRTAGRIYTRQRTGIPVMGGKVVTAVCPLCNRRGKLVPDHDHKTGKFRGWICGCCNRALGVYEKYKPLFEKFEHYLLRAHCWSGKWVTSLRRNSASVACVTHIWVTA